MEHEKWNAVPNATLGPAAKLYPHQVETVPGITLAAVRTIEHARLIAAVPDLLVACRLALKFGEGHPDRTPNWNDERLQQQVVLRAALNAAGLDI